MESTSKEIRQGWDYAARSTGVVGAVQADNYLAFIEDTIRQLENALNNHPYKHLPIDQFQGYVFEDYSAETFNINAAAAGSMDRARALGSHGLGSVDVELDSGKKYSMKSYATGEKSATEQARLNTETRQPLYKGQYRAVPTDKLQQAREASFRREARAQGNKQDVAEAYRETRDKLTDIVENDKGIKSRPVTREELDKMATEAEKGEFRAEDHGITSESVIETKYLLEQAGKAGLTAAAITMALQLAPEIIKAIDYLIHTGEIQLDKLLTASEKAVSAGAESFLRGAAAFTLTAAAESGKLGVIKNLNPTLIGMLVVIMIQTVKDSILVASGKMEPRQLGVSLVRTTVISGMTVLSLSTIMKLSAAAGYAMNPVIGFVIGTLVGCTVAVLYDIGKKHLISFCKNSGFTCFGLVEQDYTLPEEVLHELGIETITIPRIEVPRVQHETVSYTQEPEKAQFETVEYTMLKRGIIGVNRIGYIPRTGY